MPVVSTTLGAEGLGLEPDVHLLVADEAGAFAAACVRLLEDRDLRLRLTEEANRLFLERFQWTSSMEVMKKLMLETAQAGQTSTSTLRPPSHRLRTRYGPFSAPWS